MKLPLDKAGLLLLGTDCKSWFCLTAPALLLVIMPSSSPLVWEERTLSCLSLVESLPPLGLASLTLHSLPEISSALNESFSVAGSDMLPVLALKFLSQAIGDNSCTTLQDEPFPMGTIIGGRIWAGFSDFRSSKCKEAVYFIFYKKIFFLSSILDIH